MPLLKRNPERAPALVAQSWKRIEAWLRANCPHMHRALQPGVKESELRKAEAALGRPLPDGVKESYRIHNAYRAIGGDDAWYDLFFNLPLAGSRKGTQTSVVGVWESLNEDYRDNSKMLESPPPRYDWYAWRPEGFLRKAYLSPGWLPLDDDGGGNYLGVDLDPGPKGAVGQVINFGRDEHKMWILAHSWEQFLEDVADEMEAGHFEFGGEYEGLWLNTPRREPLYTQYEAWSRAKLDPKFHRVRPTPPPPPPREPPRPAADPETAERCAAVVLGFFEALHAWELRWLKVRPLAPHGLTHLAESKLAPKHGPGGFGWKRVTDTVRLLRSSSLDMTAAERRAWAEQVRRHLEIGVHYPEAMRQRRRIVAQFGTRHAVGRRDPMFRQSDPPKYRPGRHKVQRVELQDAKTARVVLNQERPDEWRRYVLKRTKAGWRIDARELSDDGREFRDVTI